MGYIEIFLRKDPKDLTPKDIEDFIPRKVEENLNLDYKDIKAFDDFDELSKDVSAFANSEGGLLILGVSEERIKKNGEIIKIFPKEITWGDKSLSKEKLEDNLIGKIRDRIDRLRIIPIRKNDGAVIFLVDIPQSENPPHMASDNRYYKRLNFRRVPMEHYEVRDFFGKRRKPDLHLGLKIKNLTILSDLSTQFEMELYLYNSGKAVAKYVELLFGFQHTIEIIGHSGRLLDRINELYSGIPTFQYSLPIDSVIHPTITRRIGNITLKMPSQMEFIKFGYTIYAEEMTEKIIPETILRRDDIKELENRLTLLD